jgi:phosphocarrier protein HPr
MYKKYAIVKSQYGIHARPSAAIALAVTNDFPGTEVALFDPITNQQADARSVLEIMMLALQCGVEVVVSAFGKDEEKAVEAIVGIIETFEVEVR